MENKNVIILHDDIIGSCREDELDVLNQAGFVAKTLGKAGYLVTLIPFNLKQISEVIEKLTIIKPEFVVNLVETINGSSALCFIPCAVLENLKIKYTGNSAHAIYITTNKLFTKRLLTALDIKTPEWIDINGEGVFLTDEKYILKPLSEEGSLGINDSCIVECCSKDALIKIIKEKSISSGLEYFAERYINGREFSVSILGNNGEPCIFPVSEMLFLGYDDMGLPQILNYDSKWKEDSFVYNSSVRSFETNKKDGLLMGEIIDISKKCWYHYKLRGYARIDFRVDSDNNPWVIDINANPCISEDSGFIAAAEKKGIIKQDVILKIISELK